MLAGSCKRLTRYACTPFLSTAKEREERMPPLKGAADAKIHILASGFGQYEFWPRPPLACRRRIRRERTIRQTATFGRDFAQSRMVETLRAAAPMLAGSCKRLTRYACTPFMLAGSCKRLTRYACTPFLSTAKEREERMPPPNPPPSRHAGALDAKIHKLASGFGQYEFWPRPTLACRAADKAGTRYPTDCNVRAGISHKAAW